MVLDLGEPLFFPIDALDTSRYHRRMQKPHRWGPMLPAMAISDAELVSRATAQLHASWQSIQWDELTVGLLGCPVTARIEPAQLTSRDALSDRFPPDAAAALLCLLPNAELKIAVQCEKRLAACLVDRVMGGEAGQDIPEPLIPFSEAEQGVFGYAVAHFLTAGKVGAWRLTKITQHCDSVLSLSKDDRWIVWPVLVHVGDDQGYMRLCMPSSVALFCFGRQSRPSRPMSEHLPLELTLELPPLCLAGHEVLSLEGGDIVLLGHPFEGSPEAQSPGFPELSLHLPGNPRYTWRVLSKGDGSITINSAPEDSTVPQGTVPDSKTPLSLEKLGETQLVLRIELGRFQLTAHEVSNLLPGQVVQTGLSIGSHVTLRAGEQSIATGELLDVDGELGVRILTLPPSP
ncbi:MAG: FliM/FliN family flagellar motor switch protein [Myxococcales bacterium]|nr:FliM/FliN family flagellar motor switch protein [Myxococcales bacterium]